MCTFSTTLGWYLNPEERFVDVPFYSFKYCNQVMIRVSHHFSFSIEFSDFKLEVKIKNVPRLRNCFSDTILQLISLSFLQRRYNCMDKSVASTTSFTVKF